MLVNLYYIQHQYVWSNPPPLDVKGVWYCIFNHLLQRLCHSVSQTLSIIVFFIECLQLIKANMCTNTYIHTCTQLCAFTRLLARLLACSLAHSQTHTHRERCTQLLDSMLFVVVFMSTNQFFLSFWISSAILILMVISRVTGVWRSVNLNNQTVWVWNSAGA